jgi:hypothetical protein
LISLLSFLESRLIIVDVHHAYLEECAVRTMQKKLSYEGGNSDRKKCNEATVAPRWRSVESAFGGSLESGRYFCVGAFGRNRAQVAVKMFSHLQKNI